MKIDELFATQPKEEVSLDALFTQTPPPQELENEYGATFRASPTDTPLKAGLKSLGNVPSSFYNLGKGLVKAVANPTETAKGVARIVRGAGSSVGRQVLEQTPLADKINQTPLREDEQSFKLLMEYAKRRYGSMENLQKTATEDPAGFGTDILSAITGGATLAGKTAELSTAISKVASPVTTATSKTASGIANAAKETTGFATSQMTGLSRDTIRTAFNESADLSVAQKAGRTRVDLADDVYTAVTKAQDDLGDLGSGYDAVRQSTAQVVLPEAWAPSAIQKYGLKIDDDGRVFADKSSKTRNQTDIAQIQNFLDNWGDSRTLTPNEYLNMRHDLAELAKYDTSGKSTVVRDFGRDVREGFLNKDDIREQVPGLKELDAKYSADREFLNSIEKDYIDRKTGTLKDGAASKLVNAVTAANPERLARIEKFYPGFTKQARLIKAIEDIEAASGIKVGTYTRAGLVGGQIATGNIPSAIITAILSQPEIAVPLIKGLGYTKDALAPVLHTIYSIGSDINNIRFPQVIQQELEKRYPDGVPVGLSIEDVTKTRNPLEQEALKYKSAEEFIGKMKGSSTQYDSYSPQQREYLPSDFKNLSELGIDPEKTITIYRGIDDSSGKVKRSINDGDFVTTDFDSALSYTGSPKDVVEMKVKAKHLYNDAETDFRDDPFYTGSEYVYSTKQIKPLPSDSQLTDIYNKAHRTTVNKLSQFHPEDRAFLEELTVKNKISPEDYNIAKQTLMGYGLEVPPTPSALKGYLEEVFQSDFNKKADASLRKSQP